MAQDLDYSDLNDSVGGGDVPVRLFPVRLHLLDRLLGLHIEHWIDSLVLQPLRSLTPENTWTGPYRFDPRTFCRPADFSAPPSDWCFQFASDLQVLGLQEAIILF